MRPRRIARTVGILFGYAVLFYVFDTQATFFEIAPGVSLWYPSAGLNLALVLILGAEYAPAIFAALLVSGLWISTPPIPLQHLLLPDLAIAAGNGLAAWGLQRLLRDRTLFSPGAVLRIVGVMAGLAAWNSLFAVGSYLLTGLEGYAPSTAPVTALKWWIGDWAGMLTLTIPLLFAALAADFPETAATWTDTEDLQWPHSPPVILELLGEVGALALSIYGAFYLQPGGYQLYLCFLPVLWMALRHGLPRSALGVLIINLGAALVLHSQGNPTSILKLQLFIIALSLTGLFLGALVSERKRAFGMLQQTLDALEVAGGHSTKTGGAPRVSFHDDALRLADRLRTKQEQLAESTGTLLHQNKRKNQLFSIIAHDLKNLVGTSMGLADMIENEAQTLPRDSIAKLAYHLSRSTEQAQDVLSTLLEWTRMYVGNAEEKQSEHEAAALIDSVFRNVSQAAARKNIALERDVEPDLTVYGHPALLQSVTRNLVSNAIKYTEEGGRVMVRAHASEDGTTLCVRDNGIGIPNDELDQLFQPVQGQSKKGTGGERGSGLGLALCREIVEQHGGSIWAESEPGEGSAFYFTIPHPSDAPQAKSPPIEGPLPTD